MSQIVGVHLVVASDNGANVIFKVKIWFQNRRTKYKQDRQFEEMGASKSNKRKGEHHVRKWQMETNVGGVVKQEM